MEQGKQIIVGIADMRISEAPDLLITRGLGSCLGITVYDPYKKIGALAHPMLPDITRARIKSKPNKFVESAIKKMIEKLCDKGSARRRLEVKIFGGGHMFKTISSHSPLNIGAKNLNKAREVLKSLKIGIAGQDSGGNFGRTIELDLATGKVKVKTIYHGEKEV